MQDQAVSLTMLDAYIAQKHKRLTFPRELEVQYDQRMDSYRRQVMARGLMPTVSVYNAFLVADFLLLPQTAITATILHLAVVTPVIFLAAFLYPRTSNTLLREVFRSFVPFMMVAQIMYIYAQNAGIGADQYQYLAVMTVIYMNINLRFSFNLAIASTLLLMMTYLAVLLPGHSPVEVKFTGTCMMGAAAYLTLMANRRMEQDVRFGFLRRLQDQLRREAAEKVSKHDAMTGLANRRMLDEVVARLWAEGARDHTLAAVVMIDVDHFKPFNDRYGHAAGDECLVRVAGLIADELKSPQDLAFRFGGEEFLLLLPGTDMGDAVRIAERLRVAIENVAIPHEDLVPRGVVTASFGVTAGPVSAHSFAELLSAADAALYAAKGNGRNQVWPPLNKHRDAGADMKDQAAIAARPAR
ncbi:MAG: GGDEF domain-containing protein [Hoeflea sp.]|nr:GGDEF domain-containing protein [Hoeflea sp.]